VDQRPAGTLEERLQKLRKNFFLSLPDRSRAIEESLSTALRPDAGPDAARTAYRLLHTLTGTAGTYGFNDVSTAARALLELSEPDGAGLAGRAEEIRRELAAFREAAATACLPELPGCTMSESARRAADVARRVLVAASDPRLGEQLRTYGFDATPCRSPEALARATTDGPPPLAALVEPGPGEAWRAALAALRTSKIPLIFLTAAATLPARLEAARAGGVAFFRTPADAAEIADRLDRLAEDRRSDPYRVLIVDDDADLVRHLGTVLDAAGMRTQAVTDPMAVEGPLRELAPDLILLDVSMPGCSGPELAAVIRQLEDHVATPIVYLSAETRRETQIAAQRAGGDDFLVKPIAPDRLVDEVALRAERGRALRRLMVRDGLTGLLNHTTLMSQLDLEVARAVRRKSALSFAMIDIDHFKKVNDTYGHPTGDRVLRALSRVLTQRLRSTDIVGRYGGEEFGLVLLDSPGPAAYDVLDDLRTRFAALPHRAGDGEFTVTFSVGLAALPPHGDATLLRDVADRALYQAKHQGRNRIVFAEG
jgi:diguanylate cyclase (GGDEF)-like protein